MMKMIPLSFMLYASMIFSQTAQVGINTTTPDASAILHIENFTGIPATAVATVSGGAVTSVTCLAEAKAIPVYLQ